MMSACMPFRCRYPSVQEGGADNALQLKKQISLYASALGVPSSSTGPEPDFTSPAVILRPGVIKSDKLFGDACLYLALDRTSVG